MKNIFNRISARVRRPYEQRVDDIVEFMARPGFPVQLYFMKDGLGLGVVCKGFVTGQYVAGTLSNPVAVALPGMKPDKLINADYPNGLDLLYEVLKRTSASAAPKGLIKSAVREAWRRKFNDLQMEKAQLQLDAAQAGGLTGDRLETVRLLDNVFRESDK